MTGRAPQKSRAWSEVIRGPWPENSRSKGRKTACVQGRMEVKVKSHSSTRCGIRRSSDVRRSVWSRELKPVVSRSRRSSTTKFGARFWIQRWRWVLLLLTQTQQDQCTRSYVTSLLKSSTGNLKSSPSKIINNLTFKKGHASSAVMLLSPYFASS